MPRKRRTLQVMMVETHLLLGKLPLLAEEAEAPIQTLVVQVVLAEEAVMLICLPVLRRVGLVRQVKVMLGALVTL